MNSELTKEMKTNTNSLSVTKMISLYNINNYGNFDKVGASILGFFAKAFNSSICTNQSTKVPTLRCQRVNRNIKFDYENAYNV